MRYSLGQNLADFGFGFFEKIHEPIFLVHRLGKIIKINEAGRKLLAVAKISIQDLDFLTNHVASIFGSRNNEYQRISLQRNGWNLIARSLKDSDFILVEIKR